MHTQCNAHIKSETVIWSLAAGPMEIKLNFYYIVPDSPGCGQAYRLMVIRALLAGPLDGVAAGRCRLNWIQNRATSHAAPAEHLQGSAYVHQWAAGPNAHARLQHALQCLLLELHSPGFVHHGYQRCCLQQART